MGFLVCFVLGVFVGSVVVFLYYNPEDREQLRDLFKRRDKHD